MRLINTLVLVALWLLTTTVHAQLINPAKVKFGKISMDELELKTHPVQPDAEAVVLFDESRMRMDFDQETEGLEFIIDRHIRIKILKPSGTHYGDFEFWLERSTRSSAREEMLTVKGSTYNLSSSGDMEEVKLGKEHIFEESITEGVNRYAIAFPQVKEGTVIELKYTMKTDYIFNLPTWYFQREIPTEYSLIEAVIPEYYVYNIDMKGFASDRLIENVVGQTGSGFVNVTYRTGGGRPSTDISTSSVGSRVTERIDFRTKTYRWAASQVPGLASEPLAPEVFNYFFRVDFELSATNFPGAINQNFSRSWEAVCAIYSESSTVKDYLNPKGEVVEQAKNWTAGLQTETEKATAVYNKLQTTIAWNERFSMFPSASPMNILKKGEGTSADMNLMLLAMLRSLDLQADPVLVSTRDNGFLSVSRPSLMQFNHVIVQVKLADGSRLLLDPVSKDVVVPLLPLHDLNDRGRVIYESSSEWVDLKAPASDKTAYMLNVQLSEEGTLSGTAKIKLTDYAALKAKRETDGAKGVNEWLANQYAFQADEVEVSGLEQKGEPVNISFTVDASDFVQSNGSLFYVQSVMAQIYDENPLKEEKRSMPVDFTTQRDIVYVMQLVLPEGYQLEEMPESVTFSTEGGKARYSLKFSDMSGSVQIVEKLSFNNHFFSAQEYLGLKNFIDLILEKEQTPLVIKKI
ncbi:MAG: transglutaminase domain-containing protein [Saprospiraceae bacterium]